MNGTAVLLDLYDRIPPLVEQVVRDLGPAQLTHRPAPDANPIGWLVWHLARVQDDHVAELMGEAQLWVDGPWAGRFGLEPDAANIGFGHSTADVATVRPDGAEVLVDYHRAVFDRTRAYLSTLTDAELDDIVDERWVPPVSRGVRLVSVADDCLEHLGQAAYVRGMLDQP